MQHELFMACGCGFFYIFYDYHKRSKNEAVGKEHDRQEGHWPAMYFVG